jgi:hypothetical protein
MRSCSSSVLVQETAEQVASVDSGWRVAADEGHSSGWIRRLKLQRPVGTMSVVVRDVHLEDPLQVPGGPRPVTSPDPRRERCRPTVPRRRWRWVPAAAFGAARDPRCRTRRRTRDRTSRHGRESRSAPVGRARPTPVAGCGPVGDPGAVGVGGHASEVDSAGGHFDEEQHLQPLQPHRIDGKEVTCHDPGSLLAQERPPGGGRRPRRRIQAMTAQRHTDRVAETCTPSRSSSPWIRW